LHKVESDKQADSGGTTWLDSDQDNRTGHIDYCETDHGEEGLIPFGDDETGISVYTTLRSIKNAHAIAI